MNVDHQSGLFSLGNEQLGDPLMDQPHGDAEGGFPLKLLVDSKTNKVVFAEAGKELVDFFFGLMLLPMGTLVSLVGKESAPGSMGKLYQSIRDLDSTYISGGPATTSPDKVKDELTNPPILSSRLSQGGLRMPWKIATTAPDPSKLYRCSGGFRSGGFCSGGFGSGSFGNVICVSQVYGARCPSCGNQTTQEVTLLQTGGVKVESDQGREKGFVKEVVTYTITDDLSIAPLSAVSSLSLIKGLKVNDLGALKERSVMVGVKQGIKILEASLRSETVLSDVFLSKDERP